MKDYKKLIIASHNKYKIIEIREILKDIPGHIYSLQDLSWQIRPEEEGATYFDNAYKKAKIVFDHFGLATIGEDSGLEVDALKGEPGIFSARYSGEDATDEKNNTKLIQKLQGISFETRTARYRCSVVCLLTKDQMVNFEGSCEGIISYERKGKLGFGYDPLFFLPEYQQTFAELEPDIKNQISHRAKALAQLKQFLQNYY